jgi:hypothetical protein
MLPADVDGSTLPPSGAPGIFIEADDDGAGFPQDQLDVWNATADWNALTLTMTRARSAWRPHPSTPTCAGSPSASRSRGRASASKRSPTA